MKDILHLDENIEKMVSICLINLSESQWKVSQHEFVNSLIWQHKISKEYNNYQFTAIDFILFVCLLQITKFRFCWYTPSHNFNYINIH